MTDHRPHTIAIGRDLLDTVARRLEDCVLDLDALRRALGDAIRGYWATRHDPMPDDRVIQCTGLAAEWCPIHGTCVCRQKAEAAGQEWSGSLDDPDCPLHNPNSDHPERTEHIVSAGALNAILADPPGPTPHAENLIADLGQRERGVQVVVRHAPVSQGWHSRPAGWRDRSRVASGDELRKLLRQAGWYPDRLGEAPGWRSPDGRWVANVVMNDFPHTCAVRLCRVYPLSD